MSSSRDHHSRSTLVVTLLLTAGVAALSITHFLHNGTRELLASTITLVGLTLTAGSVALAVAIFRNQGRDSEEKHDELKELQADLNNVATDTRTIASTSKEVLDDLRRVTGRILTASIGDPSMAPVIAHQLRLVGKHRESAQPNGYSAADDAADTEDVNLEFGLLASDLIAAGADPRHLNQFRIVSGNSIPIRDLGSLFTHFDNDDDANARLHCDRTQLKPDQIIGFRLRRAKNTVWYLSTPDKGVQGKRYKDQPRPRSLWVVRPSGAVELVT